MADFPVPELIAVTGGIGSGKSTVGRILEGLGELVIDADDIAREITSPGSPILAEIASTLGRELIREDGSLDRKLTAEVVFDDPVKRKALEDILHPAIIHQYKSRAVESGKRRVFIQIPLLFEAGLVEEYDQIWLCYAPESLRLERVIKRDNAGRDDVMARMRNQLPDEEKLSGADVVIDMAGSLDEVREQVENALRSIS